MLRAAHLTSSWHPLAAVLQALGRKELREFPECYQSWHFIGERFKKTDKVEGRGATRAEWLSSALPEAGEEGAQRVPALGAVGLGQLLGGRLGGGRDGAGQHQAQLSLGRRSARSAEAGAERAALRAGPAATAEPGDDLPPELPAARAVGGAAPRLSAIHAALLRPAARRRPAAQPQLAAPRRPAHLPAAPVLLRCGEMPRRRRLRARPAARGPQRGQRQQGQGQPHLSVPRVPPPVPRRRRGPAEDPPHAPRPAGTRGCRGAAVPLLGTAAPLSARLSPLPSPSLPPLSPADRELSASGLPNTAGDRAARLESPVAPLPPLMPPWHR